MLQIPEETKKLFKQGSIRKNIRIHFPNGEREDITNNNLISESFSFTESVMSQGTFKFGLCEASMVEFECFGIENIKGYEIEVFHEIDISSLGEEFIAEHGMTSNDVAFPFYRIPYGRFVIDECLRQADATKRKIVAYTNEVDWENIPNPLEKAKSNGLIDLKYNSPYTFNVASVVYANTYTGETDFFNEKTLLENGNGYFDFLVTTLFSSAIAKSPSGAQYIEKYECYLYLESIYQTIASNEDADNLYWLKYKNSDNVDNFVDSYKSVINNDTYVWNKEYRGLNLEEIIKAIKHSFFQYNQYNYNSVYDKKILPLSDYRYVYPFMNYASKEQAEIYGSLDIEHKTLFGVPYSVRLEIIENSIDNYGNVTKQKHIEKFNLRNAEEISFYIINNLPKLRMSVNREKININGSTKYRFNPTNINIRSLVEGYIEINGKLGKSNRNGYFDMVSINNNFGLVPSNLLVPSNSLVPSSLKGEVAKKEIYSSLWYDDYKTLPYDKVSVSYKNTDGEEEYAEKWLVDSESENYNANNYQEYSLTENYLIKNGTFTKEQINQILDMVSSSLVGLQYMPFEMESVGIPYLESGDALLVETNDNDFQTLILNRRIEGIQSLKDNFNAD